MEIRRIKSIGPLLPLLFLVYAFPATGDTTTAPGEEFKSPGRFALTIKKGFLSLADDTQTIAGTERHFDEHADNDASIEFEWRGRPLDDLWLSGEFLGYSNRFRRRTSQSNEDTLDVWGFMVKSKYYFRSGRSLQPYAGAGAGILWVTDWTGPIEGLQIGIGLQGVVGMQWRTERFGVRAEYSYLYAGVEDNKNDHVNISTHGAFIGVSFYFGPSR